MPDYWHGHKTLVFLVKDLIYKSSVCLWHLGFLTMAVEWGEAYQAPLWRNEQKKKKKKLSMIFDDIHKIYALFS